LNILKAFVNERSILLGDQVVSGLKSGPAQYIVKDCPRVKTILDEWPAIFLQFEVWKFIIIIVLIAYN